MFESNGSKVAISVFAIGIGVWIFAYAQLWIRESATFFTVFLMAVIVTWLYISKTEKKFNMEEVVGNMDTLMTNVRNAKLKTASEIKHIYQKGFEGKTWVMEVKDEGVTNRIDIDVKTGQPVALGINVEAEKTPPFMRNKEIGYNGRDVTPERVQELLDRMNSRDE